MRGFDALRALLGYEYSIGSWFSVVPYIKARPGRDAGPFGEGKVRPVMLATQLGPDAILYPRSTRRGCFSHDAHRHDPPGPCRINKSGWVKLRVPVTVDQDELNEKTFSCEEPEGSPLLTTVREVLRP